MEKEWVIYTHAESSCLWVQKRMTEEEDKRNDGCIEEFKSYNTKEQAEEEAGVLALNWGFSYGGITD